MPDARRQQLVQQLRAWGLNGLAAAMLESGGPLPLLGAQALYAAQPLLGGSGLGDDVAGLARLLEDPGQVAALASELRGPEEAGEHAAG